MLGGCSVILNNRGYWTIRLLSILLIRTLGAQLNFYNVHYAYTHIVETSGGNTDDMKEELDVMTKGLDPAGLVTHIGGLNAVTGTTLHLPNIPGGKKLIYTHLDLPLTAITDFAEMGKTEPMFAKLTEICDRHQDCGRLKPKSIF